VCVNKLSEVALDSAAAGIEPATSSRKSNALTTAPPSHHLGCHFFPEYVGEFKNGKSRGESKKFEKHHKICFLGKNVLFSPQSSM